MSFSWPFMLYLLLALPLLVWLYLRLQQRRRQFAERFGTLGLVQAGSGSRRSLGFRRHLPPLFFLSGLVILILAAARPQASVNLPKIEGTVILAFDVSGSMAAADLQPTRMDAAKTAAIEFVKSQPSSVQIGVVAFSDSGFSVQPPTNEQEVLLSAIQRLGPERGTSLGSGILTSLETIAAATGQKPQAPPADPGNALPSTGLPQLEGNFKSAIIVLLTDGENNERPDPLEAAETAADLSVRIFPVGIGSPEGTILEVNGFTVHTMLNEAMLEQIAYLTGGDYFNAASSEDMGKIYSQITPQLVIEPEKMEITSIFAGASILILLVGGLLSLLWLSRIP
jgi:Ca-activated chloride channel family protein